MAANRPPTEDEVAKVRELAARGHGRNAIAANLGRGLSTVDAIAKRLGITFDRSATRAAVAARQADQRARRAELSEIYLDLARAHAVAQTLPHQLVSFGGDEHRVVTHEIPEPTPSDKARLMQASKTAIECHARLESLDTEQGMSAVDRWLDAITGPADPGV